jgi:hypothetical protein
MPDAATRALNLRAIDRRLHRTLVALDAANLGLLIRYPPVHNRATEQPAGPRESKQQPNRESGANRVIAGHAERVATKFVVLARPSADLPIPRPDDLTKPQARNHKMRVFSRRS